MVKISKWTTIRVLKTLRKKIDKDIKKSGDFVSVSSYVSYVLNKELEK